MRHFDRAGHLCSLPTAPSDWAIEAGAFALKGIIALQIIGMLLGLGILAAGRITPAVTAPGNSLLAQQGGHSGG